MEMTRRAARAALILILIALVKVSCKRPESVLADIFTTPFVPRANASFECIRDGEIYLRALNNYTPWALQMYDSSVKIPSGLITGNYRTLGNFDECLRVNSNEHGFIGQACNVGVQFHIQPDNDTSRELDLADLFRNIAIASGVIDWTSGVTVIYEWIWCVPSTCSYSEIGKAAEAAFQPLTVPGHINLTINVHQKSCHTLETNKTTWDIADCCYVSLFALFALIVVISTAYDIAPERWIRSLWKSDEKAEQWKAILTSFSLHKNGKELLRTDRPQNYLGCVDGLRFLSICWIIYGHTNYTEAIGAKLNLADIRLMHLDWTNMLVLNANVATDTFFLLSGLALAYTELSKKRVSNFCFYSVKLWIRRYIRLTPAYAMMIGFYATLFYKLGTGPHWDLLVGTNRDYCRTNWWVNLIYLNNYINLDKMCMSQSWYLSVDMQLVWLSPLILYPMLKSKRLFIIILSVFLLLSCLVPFAITYTLGLPGTMLYYKDQTSLADVYVQIYSKFYCRFGAYIIGLGLGYIFYKRRHSSVKMRTWVVVCGWLIAITIGLTALLGSRDFYFDDHDYNKLEASFYAGLHRHVFALSISWIIFCCMHNYGGPVNSLLSWPGWVPFRKLTYCAYLSHYVILMSDIGSARTTGNLTRMNVARTFFANLVFTMAVSVPWYLFFERPFLVLEKQIIDRKPQGSPEQRKGDGFTGPDAQGCKSTDESSKEIECGSQGQSTKTEEKHEGPKAKKDQINEASRDVYLSARNDDASSKTPAYINVGFYRSFSEHEPESIRITSGTNVRIQRIRPTLKVKSNESLHR